MKIRDYALSDYEALCQLHLKTFRSVGETKQTFLSLLADDRYLFYVAEDQAKLAGYVIFSCQGSVLYLNWIGVRASLQKKGIGKALLRAAEEWGKSRKLKSVGADSRNRFQDALIFYLRNGFEITGTFLGGDRDLMIRFRKPKLGLKPKKGAKV